MMITQLNASWREASKTDLKSFKTYLSGLSDSKERKTLYAAAKLILAGYEKEKRINMLEEVIRDYDKQPIAETALMSKFLYYFNEQKNYKAATGILTEISQKFPQSSVLQEAQQHMALIEIYCQLKSTNELPNNSTQQLNVDSDIIENYPNPFNPTTQISFTLKERANISLKVYDVLGKEAANLADGYYEAGKHTATFDGSNLASGIYFYRLTTPSSTIIKKIMLLK
ncbi:MAG: T9SS type A sorting domain-containing protein [Bacteroidota bacterium]